jgi:antitoxin VapB
MAIHIRDQRIDALVRELARVKGKGLTETIREACQNELERERDARPLSERLRPIIERYRALPDSGEKADKAFFDELSGNL